VRDPYLINWFGILICLIHSAIFSGLNLGFFGLSRLRLEVQALTGNVEARNILGLRKDTHFLLSTLLWGNVASNVLLAMLAESMLSGMAAFIFSTVGITFLGEIFPQAYLSRHILRVSVVLVPIVKFYQTLLYPVAKPTALVLDAWLGKEKIGYFNETEIIALLEQHYCSNITDLAKLESMGAINFLTLDDIRLEDEGELVNPASVITLPTNERGLPLFPEYSRDMEDEFLRSVHASGEKWVIIVNPEGAPLLVLNANKFLREVMFAPEVKSIYTYCHKPIVVDQPGALLGEVILKFRVRPEHSEDDVVDNDIILFWANQKKIVTGADILGRLLRGIVSKF
jgi:metal transporter CNNM